MFDGAKFVVVATVSFCNIDKDIGDEDNDVILDVLSSSIST
jgi:hypothetical protein